MSPKIKIPTKTELLQLQKIYKTDEKIGERLGGVPAYLVAYWRRKKNIPKHSQPKFSEKEILTLWERYGDDDKCGMELGISKAAFYNWRRRYGIKEKPAFLKLEQLELNFPGLKLNSSSTSLYGKQSITQKIITNLSEDKKAEVGEELKIEPDMLISGLESRAIVDKFKTLNNELIWNPGKITIAMSSTLAINNSLGMTATKQLREFANRQGVKNLIEKIEGSPYQVALERGYALPGQFVLGTESFVAGMGSIGSFTHHIDCEKAASVWEQGKIVLRIPQSIRIDINGRRSRGVYGKDIALTVMKQLKDVNVKDKVIEYYGNVVSQMSISERYTLCCQTIGLGALSAICSFDSVTRRYFSGRTHISYTPFIADKNAEYVEMYQINIDNLTPQVSLSNDEGAIKAVAEYENVPVNLIIMGTTSNGRFEDLRVASEILKGRRVHPECRFLIYPASRTVYLEALKKGLIRILVEAGAAIIYPGYWNNIDGTTLEANEKGMATFSNGMAERFFKGDFELFNCSPATAAASAINGTITDPVRYLK